MRKSKKSAAEAISKTKGIIAPPEPKRKKKLSITEMEQKFMAEYLKDYDAVAAMKRCGYKDPRSIQCRKIIERLEPLMKQAQVEKARKIGEAAFTSQERVLEHLARQAHYDPADFVVIEEQPDPKDPQKRVTVRKRKPIEQLTPEQRQCIKLHFAQDGTATYSMLDQRGAQVLIGRHLGMFNDKLIMEHRHRMMNKRADLSAVPDAVLEQIETAYLEHMGPQAARMIGEFPELEEA